MESPANLNLINPSLPSLRQRFLKGLPSVFTGGKPRFPFFSCFLVLKSYFSFNKFPIYLGFVSLSFLWELVCFVLVCFDVFHDRGYRSAWFSWVWFRFEGYHGITSMVDCSEHSGENQSDGNKCVYSNHLQIAQLPLQEGRIQQRYFSASVQFRLCL